MEQYISKDALVAEIENIEKALKDACEPNLFGNVEECMTAAELEALGAVKEIIDTLEVKEVDLENIAVIEWDNYIRKIDGDPNNAYMLIERNQYIDLARHFFELILHAQKGE